MEQYLTKLTIAEPDYGWSSLKLDNNVYEISYSTDAGVDFLKVAYNNYMNKKKGNVFTIIFDTEEAGCFYFILCNRFLTICSVDEDFVRHYLFDSPKEIMRQVYESIAPYAEAWAHFFYDENKDSTEEINSLLNLIKEEL